MADACKYSLHCLQCQRRYSADAVSYFCPHCELDGALDLEYDYRGQRAAFVAALGPGSPFDMWRYHPLLPVSGDGVPALHTGGSPLYEAAAAGGGRVFIKDDSRNPSGSLKDRASALAVTLAQQRGASVIAAASTGNAAAALACMSAASELRCVIFAPANAAREKLAQIRAYGAEVTEVQGAYDEAFAACHHACLQHGWYNRSTGLNAYMTEGKKTVAFEIYEQLGRRVPDRVYVPVGNGCIVGAVYKGFRELVDMGLEARVPQIIGVQATGSDYLWRAWQAGNGPHAAQALAPRTAASSISVALPRDRIKALRAVQASGGEFLRVSDAAIYESVIGLARRCGVFAEPGAATAYAGALVHGAFTAPLTSVVLVTGSGLKDVSGLLSSGLLSRPAHAAALETLTDGVRACLRAAAWGPPPPLARA
ncbi:threonine synthase [Inhella proteolytica]|uniref:Threonine synthase n=1 Tax=Inhella proteolytica TaxID=2795029 RepID=A0A931NIT5_9BURK|nr:threonine synthase [Inhella proteolytica]MBH9577925.1 threonine synthase [Inhella proteolytica]